MEEFSALLALCAGTGNSPVTGEFPSQRPVKRSFEVFFSLRLKKRLSKQSRGWWFETPSRSLWCHCNAKNFSTEVANPWKWISWIICTLQWRHNEHDGVSKHRRIVCLLIRFFRRRSKKRSKLRVTGLYEGNQPVTGRFPSPRVGNVERCFHLMTSSWKSLFHICNIQGARWAVTVELLPDIRKDTRGSGPALQRWDRREKVTIGKALHLTMHC